MFNLLCVDHPEIEDIINLETGDIQPVQVIIGSDYAKLEKFRMDLAQASASDELLYACPICIGWSVSVLR